MVELFFHLPASAKIFSFVTKISAAHMNALEMYNWKHLLAGIGIASVIILSSVPLIVVDDRSLQTSVDYCTATHGKAESDCKGDKEHNCVWCISRAVPGMCYDESSAHQLPPSVFNCDFNFDGLEGEKLETA